MRSLLHLFYFGILLLSLAPSFASAAACCAGSAAVPSLILGDDRMQVSFMGSRSQVIGDANADGLPVFRASNNTEILQSVRMDLATLISDRWQLGASLPFQYRSLSAGQNTSTSAGLGDLRLSVGYEILPEWGYSEWRPKGITFFQLTLPFAKSIYEATDFRASDALSRGFFALTTGMVFQKKWQVWDVYLIPEVHYSFQRNFLQPNDEGLTVIPGFGTSATLGVGLSPGSGNLRLGLRLAPTYQQPKMIRMESSPSSITTAFQQTWDTALEASYLVSSKFTLIANYLDQTLLGPAVNSTLSRSIVIGFQNRWER